MNCVSQETTKELEVVQNTCCFPVTGTSLFPLKQSVKDQLQRQRSIDFGVLNIHVKFSGNLTVWKLYEKFWRQNSKNVAIMYRNIFLLYLFCTSRKRISMPRTVKEFKVVLLYSSCLAVYTCEKSDLRLWCFPANVCGRREQKQSCQWILLALTLFPVPAQQIPKAMAAP